MGTMATVSWIQNYSRKRLAERKVTYERRFHSHSIPLDMADIKAELDTPLLEASLAAKASVIMRAGLLDLGGGTGSFRVKEMMSRIAEALGINVRADISLTSIDASFSDGKQRITEIVDLPTVGVNTERIWLMEHYTDWLCVSLGKPGTYHVDTDSSANFISHLENSRRSETSIKNIHEDDHDVSTANSVSTANNANSVNEANSTDVCASLSVRAAHERLEAIEYKAGLYSAIKKGFASAVACACFVFLLGGWGYDILGAFVGAGIGQYVRSRMSGRHLNQFFVTAVSVVIAAFATLGVLRLSAIVDPSALSHDTAYIGAILFVIPGFPLITGGLDIAKLDLKSGIERLVYALSIILVAALCAWIVVDIVRLRPSGFNNPDISVWLQLLLRLAASFGGVWGFSVLFNSPQKMAVIAASIGAIANTARLEVIDYGGMSIELAALLAALAAGLLATAWRMSVRKGLIDRTLGYPRIGLTVPSIVIMVPGLYMYRAVYYLGDFHTSLALDWTFRAVMVIVCLPIGLALARVFTDRSWRYDI